LLVLWGVHVNLGAGDVCVGSVLAYKFLDCGVLGLRIRLQVNVLFTVFNFASLDGKMVLRIFRYRVGWKNALPCTVVLE